MHVTSEMVDRELRWTGRIMRRLLRPSTPAAFRRLNRLSTLLLKGRKPKDLQVSETWIPRRDGGQQRLVIYKPLNSRAGVPGVLWAHGGGYLMGVPEQDTATYRRLIAAGECVVVAPDYRLGGEAPYPAALEDCYDALLWLKQQAGEMGVRDDQIAVGGMSAGGGLTAALTLYARDRGEVQIAFQMPLYPMIDDRMRSESSTDNDAPVWDSVSNKVAWQVYLGELYGKDVPPYAAAARALDYRGLPPTCTFVGDLEPFRDETVQYVHNLKAAGVPVAFEIYKGAYHGFDVVAPKAKISRNATAFFVHWFEFAVHNYFAPQRKQDRVVDDRLRGV
ncbi:MAG: esterase/lipase [Hydrocarboniphaga sp.]|uniref:alpha/beta hydrolase n=1 Tax=Hydrocarboniphaga sp. TaxID=2033016 RepID=UPI0026056C2E|nr:alpha/beta hydrolase [Hydrocarboniphaga sp.]MDB5968630.1 esterase/lipase [Hydrocarboniphaga sp.]